MIGAYYVALADVVLTTYTGLILNSRQSSWLSLPNAGASIRQNTQVNENLQAKELQTVSNKKMSN